MGLIDHVNVPVEPLDPSRRFYAAFVRDPDGHDVEAVCRAAKSEVSQATARRGMPFTSEGFSLLVLSEASLARNVSL
jgi:hypothetical protein